MLTGNTDRTLVNDLTRFHAYTYIITKSKNSASTEFLLEIKIDSKRLYFPQLLSKERFVHPNSGGRGQSAHAAIALAITELFKYTR